MIVSDAYRRSFRIHLLALKQAMKRGSGLSRTFGYGGDVPWGTLRAIDEAVAEQVRPPNMCRGAGK